MEFLGLLDRSECGERRGEDGGVEGFRVGSLECR